MANVVSVILCLSGLGLAAQQPQIIQPNSQPNSFSTREPSSSVKTERPVGESQSQTQPDYVLGPGDQITIRAVNVEEINDKPVLIDTGGYVRLPVVGRVRVAGE